VRSAPSALCGRGHTALGSRAALYSIASVVHVGGVNVSPEQTVSGRSSDGFKAATHAAVEVWEHQRGGLPKEVTRLQVVEMYVNVGSASVHD
jgi:hypothetical protein